MDNQKLDYLSEDVQEILSMPPSWIATWGTTVILISLLLISIVGWQFKYPEKLSGKVTLTTIEPPVSVFAHEPGYLSEILVEDNSEVSKGDVVAIYKNSAFLEDVLSLEKKVENLSSYEIEAFKNFEPLTSPVLGDILIDYTRFIASLEDFSFSNSSNFDFRELNELSNQISKKRVIIESLKKERASAERQVSAADRTLKRVTKGYSESGETKDYEKLEDALTTKTKKDNELDKIKTKIALEREEIAQIEKAITFKKSDNKSDENNRVYLLKQNLSALQASIQAWKRAKLIIAPIDGKASFYNSKTEQQFYNKGDEVMAIVPQQVENQYIGYVQVPIHGSGKIEEGQPVLLKFDRFPFHEFGHVKGKVDNITLLPKDDMYEVKVHLKDGLKTNFGRELDFRQMMSGEADIITGDKRFVSRLFEEVVSWFG